MSQVTAPGPGPSVPTRSRYSGEKQPQFLAAVPGDSSRPTSPRTPPLSPGRVRISRKCSEAEARVFCLSQPSQAQSYYLVLT